MLLPISRVRTVRQNRRRRRQAAAQESPDQNDSLLQAVYDSLRWRVNTAYHLDSGEDHPATAVASRDVRRLLDGVILQTLRWGVRHPEKRALDLWDLNSKRKLAAKELGRLEGQELP